MVPLTSLYSMSNADGTSFLTGGGLTDLVKVKYLPDDWEAKDGRPELPCRIPLSLYALVHLFNASLPIPYIFERSLAVSPCKTISFTSESFSTVFAALSLKFLAILRHGRRPLSFIFGNLKFWFWLWFSWKSCNRTYRHSNSCMLKRCFFKKKWNQFCHVQESRKVGKLNFFAKTLRVIFADFDLHGTAVINRYHWDMI